ncbi:hepatocellular carcinoma down-regulated mitochondrial carrier protein [Dactylonectria macrodidyma]|uniref:Hepatocellular carcinoma down-regulated mitochondrial carrier protein n=1 Tax=Dactylonectria macrodidyma TaxID=307937 RepID=A0A9P9DJZ0_9HYPO|nr:hepatocellular carcinoma down-regulated mitochondrial carrier protein [Dactylonectria macrodidyma]
MGIETVKDLAAGGVGGIAQVLIDIIKVRLQANGGNAAEVARNAWRKEGLLAFYKLAVGACGGSRQVSIQFGAFHYFHQPLEDRNRRQNNGRRLSNGQLEHPLYDGAADFVRKIYRQAGLAGLYCGQAVTLLREIHDYGIWFAAYEGLVSVLLQGETKTRAEVPSWKFAVCGGLTGEMLWLLSHPLDVIKSKMTWKMRGVRGLFEGLGTALLRAMAVSARTFVA